MAKLLGDSRFGHLLVWHGSFWFESRDESGLGHSEHDDLIRQEGMAIGQVEYGLMGQLLGVIGTGSPLEDDQFIRVNNVKIANSTVGNPIDVALNELGDLLVVLAEFEGMTNRGSVDERHASLPLAELHGWGDALMCSVAALVAWEVVSMTDDETWD
jgi:hypothetical protein